ncbi:ATP-binding cassette subfamily C protein CydD/ATP-binding cassette subfamily C protein CydCD [Krasilnikovia cinnamomea]|uniref:ATP-binding cassette subfamily C protein CydD/ATP-binding cassette subfamily C protein CydCD n=1 Tax=Krasilnikovia cinnamomea TaxID=349313 RepID=A0A4Q7ZTQ0_9ACTN|nr:thiol reductant ABC exporter subunit CydD [Krasilnikovia cinnamomea]RZU54602.1 ATP-binding cassette subfamily C protein CydD/ATP-binding cassette subfamily C protein CydCD [Krasilnikovia cinnamomea]
MRPLDPRLLRHARATRTYLAATAGIGAALAVLVVAQATLLADGITAVFLGGAGPAALSSTLGWLTVVVVARAALCWAQEVTSTRAAAGVKSELRGRLLSHLARLGPAARTGTGGYATLATRGLDALDAYFARYLPQLVLAALVPAIVLARLLPADLIAAVTIALTLPLIPVFMALVGWHTEAANRRQFRLLTRLSRHFLDVVAGLPTLRLFGRAKAQAETIRRISEEQRRRTMRTLRTAFLSSLVLELLATLSVALVAVGVGLRLVAGHLDLSTALLVLILAPEAYLPLRAVGANYHASAEGLAAAEEVFAVLETPVPPAGTRPAPDAATAELVFDDVEVAYPGRDGAALRLNARIAPGQIVALTGPSGCGKSTALAVLLGFAVPTRGRVTVGGVPLSEMDPARWRDRIAWVPQRPHLFAGTIRDNVTLATGAGRPGPPSAAVGHPAGPAAETGSSAARRAEAGDQEVWWALEQAGVADAVAALPGGLDTVLGDDGAGLSAGQRQRLALARAFLRDAPIVLLDEPTANLDDATAATVTAAIRRLAHGRTVVLAAHRPELIALADRALPLAPALAGAR